MNTILSIHDPLFLPLLPHSRLPTPQCLFILLIYSAETAVPPSTAFPVGMTHTHICTYTQSCTCVCLSMVLWHVYNSRRMAICTRIQFSSCRPHSHFQLLIFLLSPHLCLFFCVSLSKCRGSLLHVMLNKAHTLSQCEYGLKQCKFSDLSPDSIWSSAAPSQAPALLSQSQSRHCADRTDSDMA